MVESQVRALFEQMASSEPPPSRVNTALARSRGRTRLRWRRAGLAGAPFFAAGAAVAAVAVILAAGAAPDPSAQFGEASAAGAAPDPSAQFGEPAHAPSRFNPLIPYASFGWLPAGQALVSGGTSRTQMYLTAGPEPGGPAWLLTVYPAGRCTLTAVPGMLYCTSSAYGRQAAKITGPAPAVRGHPAFWAGGDLVWQYAPGGWALLRLPGRRGVPEQLDAIKIADHVRYGVATTPVVAFPVQLTGVPRQWLVGSIEYRPDAGVLRASRYSLTAGAVDLDAGGEYGANVPFLTTDPATSRSFCSSYLDGKSTREVIGGYKVIVNHLPLNPPEQQLCAANADGLAVVISEFGRHPPLGVVTLFEHHLRLFGPDPAKWTKAPIG
jgi:hypothetical protein